MAKILPREPACYAGYKMLMLLFKELLEDYGVLWEEREFLKAKVEDLVAHNERPEGREERLNESPKSVSEHCEDSGLTYE